MNKNTKPQYDRTIALIGMMGAGKTTIGQILAESLSLPFYDADKEIEKVINLSVGDIFKKGGETLFRKSEAQVIEHLLKGEIKILATGGGAFMNETTRAHIKNHAISIFLKTSLDELLIRINKTSKRSANRPLLDNNNPRKTLETLLQEREKYYELADIIIETTNITPKKTIQQILSELPEQYKLRH